MKEVTYSKTWQVKQYEPLSITGTIERNPGESLEKFITRSLKEFVMLTTNAQVLRQRK